MNELELKSYLLSHRGNKEAFYAHMDRRKARPHDGATKLNDPAWEEKIIAVIQKQLGCD